MIQNYHMSGEDGKSFSDLNAITHETGALAFMRRPAQLVNMPGSCQDTAAEATPRLSSQCIGAFLNNSAGDAEGSQDSRAITGGMS